MTDRKTREAQQNHVDVDNAMDIVTEKQVNLSDDDSSVQRSMNMFGMVIIMLIIISTFGELVIHI